MQTLLIKNTDKIISTNNTRDFNINNTRGFNMIWPIMPISTDER